MSNNSQGFFSCTETSCRELSQWKSTLPQCVPTPPPAPRDTLAKSSDLSGLKRRDYFKPPFFLMLGDAKAVPRPHTRSPPLLLETGVGEGGADPMAAPASGIRTGTTELGLDSVPYKADPLLFLPLPADSSIKGAGFSQFSFLFAFNLVPLLEESLLWKNRKTCPWSSFPLTRC